ncbi:ABC transporter substrate-binding protein [Parerythrobacter aurantius]|uniref:ABC transporter substrate-binding protein n=1 Tax=Parerythrobacter aurantius TaxID=3127706 RepID=UPI0032555BD5
MRLFPVVLPLVALALASCSSRANEGAVTVAVIGQTDDPAETGTRLSYAGQLVREATAEGLVALDEQGEVIPAIAERWIVTEDGKSYFFRIRGSDWPDGGDLDAASVRDSLGRAIRAYQGTTLGLDLQIVAEIRVMAERVIEVRLKSPMPEFLQLLSQPELALRTRSGKGTGPMVRLEEGDELLRLQPLAPQDRGQPQRRDWDGNVLDVVVRGLPAAPAVAAFKANEVEVVLNGDLATLPLADVGPLSAGTFRLDSGIGLFGLAFRNRDGLLEDPARREALSMAIDRARLIEGFNVAGWAPTSRLVTSGLPGDPGLRGERWGSQSLEQRRAVAARRLAGFGGEAQLTIDLPPGPGSDLLLARLAEDFAAVGVRLQRARDGDAADLVLVDRLARYADARWFLNQFNCDISRPLCSPDADVLVDQAMLAGSGAEKANLLAEAEGALTEAEVFIPLGAPLRWSLVRGGVGGFAVNRWARHPLFPFAVAPIS